MVAADATVITTNTNTSTNITSGNSDVEVKDVVKDAKVKVKVKGLVKTCIGKPYSVERYYMLSEIEQNAIRPIYLNDYNDKNNQIESESDSEDSSLSLVSPYVILYLLWDFNTFLFSDDNDNDDDYDNGAAVESFSNKIIQTAIEKLNRLLLVQVPNTTLTPIPIPPITTTNVYIVVDMLIPSSPSTASSSTASSTEDVAVAVQQKKKQYQRYITIAEELVARTISSSSDSSSSNSSNKSTTTTIKISGITVGIVNHPRAAPGLESCLDSIMIGSKDRRRIQKRQRQRRRRLVLDSGSSNRLVDSGSSNESCGTSNGINDNLKTRSTTTGSFNNDDKSCITMVCNCLDDLIGFDEEGETDAVQNVFQSRSSSSFYSQEDFDSNENEHEHEHEHDEPPILEFAENAHQYWRVHIAGLTTTAEPTIEKEEIEIQKYNNDSYSNNNTSSIKSNTTKYVVVDDSNSDINNKLVTVMVWITVLLIGYISISTTTTTTTVL